MKKKKSLHWKRGSNTKQRKNEVLHKSISLWPSAVQKIFDRLQGDQGSSTPKSRRISFIKQ